MRRHSALGLAGLGAAVLLLHVWVLDDLGAARPEAPSAATGPVRSVWALGSPAVAPLAPSVLLASADTTVSLPALEALVAARAAPPLPGLRPVDVAPAAAPRRRARADAESSAVQVAEDAASAALPDDLLLAAATTAPAAAATGGDAVPPTYRTRIPAAAKVDYRLSRGAITGSGEIDWRPQGGGYVLRLEGRVPIVGTLITQTSRGGFDAAGLAPERYTDKRLRRAEQAASFQRGAGVISFSGQSPEQPMTPGVQDRLSVMLQLAAIANAWAKPPPAGEHFLIRVIGARGDSHVWSLRFEGLQAVDTPGGSVRALRFLREPEGPQDTRAEFWLDPARQYLPVRARLTDGSSDAFELLRLN